MRHDNSLAPWGGDHAVLGHVTCFNSLILAYYLTGDLRLREVVVDEWQKTLVADRKNYQLKGRSVDLSDQLGRNNNNALGEIIDLYQLTYHPALLARMKPLLEKYPKDMWFWGQVLHNVLLFRDSEELRKILADSLDRTNVTPGFWTTHAAHELLALGMIYHPAKAQNYQERLTSVINSPDRQMWAQNIYEQRKGVSLSGIPDFVLFLPRVMYAIALAGGRGGSAAIDTSVAQPLPAADAPILARSIVREDKDEEFKISLFGKNTPKNKEDREIQVYNPNNQKIIQKRIPYGYHSAFEVTVPQDGLTGQYVIFLLSRTTEEGSGFYAPLTKLPGEVYCPLSPAYGQISYPTHYFTRASNDALQKLTLRPYESPGFITNAKGDKVLASTDKGEALTTEVGREGAWIVFNSRYTYFKEPLILSLTPDRWFAPSADKLELKPSAMAP
jgi:hypothetical protein